MFLLFLLSGLFIIFVVLWDSFETIVLPRRVTRKLRLARAFYRTTWNPWSAVARHLRPDKHRETFLSIYGPLSMLFLFSTWAVGMVLGFALLQLAFSSSIGPAAEGFPFWRDLYFSGTTFFTLGLGDVAPQTWPARIMTVIEGGIGFGFLAMVITYLPVLYEGFSRREMRISLLDARAGSPPSAGELLMRHNSAIQSLIDYLREWESFTADLMETHLSYPVLCYYRSQHSNQSWLAALATILDTCALLAAYSENAIRWQARLTFAIARHAVVDLAQVLHTPPDGKNPDRLLSGELEYLQGLLSSAGIQAGNPSHCDEEFTNLRRMYDPYLHALSRRLLMPLPSWTLRKEHPDNWRTTAWE